MSSGNEMNNETGETDFGRIAVKSNNSTEDISINQPNNSNVTTNIGFNQNNSNGGGSPKSIYSSQPNISNGTRNIRIDQLTDSSNIGNGGDIDFNNSNNRNGSIEDGDPNQLKNDNNNNNNNNTKEEEALERFNQEPSVRFLKIIEEQRADFEKSIKEDILKIEQLKLGIIEKQKKIDTLNAIIKEGKQKKSSAGKSKMLPSFSNQTVSKRPTIERKILIMEDYKKRTSTVKELCERYKITRTTFYRIKKNYMEFKGGLNEDKVDLRGRNSKLNKDCIGALYYEITTQPKGTTTVRDLTKLINQRFDLNVSPSTIHRALQKAENGWKTEARIPDSWNEPKILELRKKFVQCLPSYGKGKTEFYLGECTFNLEENVGYSWALKGRNETLANRKRQKPLHLIIAINKIGDVIKMYLNKNKNGLEEIADDTKMKQFFNENITDLKNSAIYLDNLSFHAYALNNSELGNTLGTNNISFIHYPPCSPFMHPVEYFINEIYKYIKDQAFKTREQLIYLIENGIVRNTEQEKIQLFINRANSFNQLCLNGEPINGFMLPDAKTKI